MKVNLGIAKAIVCSGITNDGYSKSKVNPCYVCIFGVMANSVLCVQCGKWIHGRCAGVQRLLQRFQGILRAENVTGILERQLCMVNSYVITWKQ